MNQDDIPKELHEQLVKSLLAMANWVHATARKGLVRLEVCSINDALNGVGSTEIRVSVAGANIKPRADGGATVDESAAPAEPLVDKEKLVDEAIKDSMDQAKKKGDA